MQSCNSDPVQNFTLHLNQSPFAMRFRFSISKAGFEKGRGDICAELGLVHDTILLPTDW